MDRLLHVGTLQDYECDIKKFPELTMTFLIGLREQQDKETCMWWIDKLSSLGMDGKGYIIITKTEWQSIKNSIELQE